MTDHTDPYSVVTGTVFVVAVETRYDHRLVIDAADRLGESAIGYELRATGEPIQTEDDEATLGSPTTTEHDDGWWTVTDTIRDWRHAYRFDGELFYLAFDDTDPQIRVLLDGEEIDPANYVLEEPYDPVPPLVTAEYVVDPETIDLAEASAADLAGVTFGRPHPTTMGIDHDDPKF